MYFNNFKGLDKVIDALERSSKVRALLYFVVFMIFLSVIAFCPAMATLVERFLT